MEENLLALIVVVGVAKLAATWTGESQHGLTIAGKPGISCEYKQDTHTFWRTFPGWICPESIRISVNQD